MSRTAAGGGKAAPLSGRQGAQIAVITVAACLVWLGLHSLTGRAALSPMDYVVGGSDALQFCDPNNPRFLPVVSRSLPVTLKFAPDGRPAVTLTTVTGKPIRPENLMPTDGALIWLFLVDPTLQHFYAVRPVPSAAPGGWIFGVPEVGSRSFRVFADVTPAATGQELYASAEWSPAPGAANFSLGSSAGQAADGADGLWRFGLQASAAQVDARRPVTLKLSVARADGSHFSIRPIGAVRAHLVAFDQAATGMVNLRSVETAGAQDQARADATFQVTFPDSGSYVLWAEVDLDGRAVTHSFPLEVVP